jgi:hypothetical protein
LIGDKQESSMRISWCLCLMLAACSSHAVRCDRHLQPINPPGRPIASKQVPAAGSSSAVEPQ